jgi:hypothetical protein
LTKRERCWKYKTFNCRALASEENHSRTTLSRYIS